MLARVLVWLFLPHSIRGATYRLPLIGHHGWSTHV